MLSGWFHEIQSILCREIPNDIIGIIICLDRNIPNHIKDMTSLYRRRSSIICSFHPDFIPDINDLHDYVGKFGKILNKIKIESYHGSKVPFASIEFESYSAVDRICDRGNIQQMYITYSVDIYQATIDIKVYRSMKEFESDNRYRFGPRSKGKGKKNCKLRFGKRRGRNKWKMVKYSQ